MKITCAFCKTEYTLNTKPNTPVKCAVCGHVWTPRFPFRPRTTLKLVVAICAFIAACLFSFVAIISSSGSLSDNKALVVTLDEKNIHLVTDENNNKKIFVSGDITNNSDDLYGLPNLVVISYDADNNVLSQQTFTPPVTLLEAKTTVTFNHTLSVDPSNVRRVSVELKESK